MTLCPYRRMCGVCFECVEEDVEDPEPETETEEVEDMNNMGVLTVPEPGNLPAKFSPSDSAIAVLAAAYMPLTIRDLDDSDGFAVVHAARMVIKGHRVEVEKTRKALKEDALNYGRLVDGEAKRLTTLLEPIESHLQEEEGRITAERERIKNAARIKAEEEERAKAATEAAAMKIEQERLAAAMKIERERFAAERSALEAERLALDAERRAQQDKVDAERRALADAELARERAADLEQAKAEAAEQAKRETEARLAREAAERGKRERDKEAARQHLEAMRPDRDKLLAVAVAVESIAIPSVSEAAFQATRRIRQALVSAGRQIRSIAEGVGRVAADEANC